MTSNNNEEIRAFLRSRQEHQVEAGGGVRARAAEQPPLPQTRSKRPPKVGEQTPLLSPPQTASQMPLSPRSTLVLPVLPIAIMPKDNGRSRSESPAGAPHSDLSHPFNVAVPPPIAGGPPRSSRPPRGSGNPPLPPPSPPLQSSVISPFLFASHQGTSGGGSHNGHRRAKSDIPLEMNGRGGGSGVSVGGGSMGRLITKADLMKNLPDPRWGGAPPTHTRNRSRTGSDGPFFSSEHGSVISVGGYGATESGHPLQSIGNVDLAPGGRHKRSGSDTSVISVTTDMAKSSLFKGVTDTGRIQLQLPKDSFRILMDRQLEAGYVYKRKLVDNEDEFFVEFHTQDDAYHVNASENQKRLPPDLYVMAVDSTIYKRMLDEVIFSRAMPCGSYYCGHHADVRHPDITIAALAVAVVFFLLLAGSVVYRTE